MIPVLKKEKYDGLDGHCYVSWANEENTHRIKASKKGVEVVGFFLESHMDLERFAKFIDEAWREHKRLVPKIAFNMSGHE